MTKQQKDYFKKERTIKLTEHEMDLIISALETDAYRSLENVTKMMIENDTYSAKINADMYIQYKKLANKVGMMKEEAR